MKSRPIVAAAITCGAFASTLAGVSSALAAPTPVAYYSNCSAARDAGAAPIYKGQDGYRSGLDRDGDGVACETGSGSTSPRPMAPPPPRLVPPAPRVAPRITPPAPVTPARPPYRPHRPLGFITAWPAFIPVPDVRFGDYCASFKNQDGYTDRLQHAFCVRVQRTDAYVWAPERRLTPQDPNVTLAVSGDDCRNGDAMARNNRGIILFCNATLNGRASGNLRYQLVPY